MILQLSSLAWLEAAFPTWTRDGEDAEHTQHPTARLRPCISFHWWYSPENRLFPTDPHFPKSPSLPTGHRSSSDILVLFVKVPWVLSQHSVGEL